MGEHDDELPGGPADAAARAGEDGSLGFEQRPAFVPPEDAPPVARAYDLEQDEELDVPPAPIEWTPDRAAAVLRGAGFMLHHADPLGSEPGGEELWRMTEQDALDAGAPLARILNRYDPARRLAGISDEAELAFAMMGYAKQHLATRGRLVAVKKAQEAEQPRPFDGAELVVDEGHVSTATVPLAGFPPPPPDDS